MVFRNLSTGFLQRTNLGAGCRGIHFLNSSERSSPKTRIRGVQSKVLTTDNHGTRSS